MMETLRKDLLSLLAIDGPNPMLKEYTFLRPEGIGPFPAVLYAHAHGGNYDLGRNELTKGATWLYAPYATDLLNAGFCVLCIDMPCFGERKSNGSEAEQARRGEWIGKPLFGQMIGDLWGAFGWLSDQNCVIDHKITAFGMSMGAALSMWLAAIETKVNALVQLCILANMAQMIEENKHIHHGPYLTVPGLLKYCDMGDIAALVSPRRQFIAHGGMDHLTPLQARQAALRTVKRSYKAENLQIFLSENSGHLETKEMRSAVLNFLHTHCR